MKTGLILAVLAAAFAPPTNFMDTPIKDISGDKDGPLDELTFGQLMRLSTLAPARLAEARCAGLVHSQIRTKSAAALSRPAADRLIDAVAGALAHDVEISLPLAREFVEGFSEQLDEEQAKRAPEEWKVWRGEREAECKALFDEARAGALTLHPLAAPSVVDPALASCYAQYRSAAARAKGEEAAGLTREAERIAALALRGKSGAQKASAELALAAEAASAAATPKGEDEADMMRLVVCQPLLRGLAKDAGTK